MCDIAAFAPICESTDRRADVDDRTAAPLEHRRNGSLGDHERAGDVETEGVLEHVRSDLHERLQDRPTGVVHHDVDTAELRPRDVGQVSRSIEVGHVGRCHDGSPAEPSDLVGDGSQR
jgi:hypothetical protein